MIVNGDFELCPGAGWEIEKVDAILEMSMKFNDCYKNILTDLCEYNVNWSGRNSLWLDECDLSNDSLIEIYDWELASLNEDTPTFGTVNPTSYSFCYALPLVS